MIFSRQIKQHFTRQFSDNKVNNLYHWMSQFALLYIIVICLLFLWCVSPVTWALGFQGHIISPQTPENSFQCWHLLLLEKEMTPHSSIPAWKSPWTEEPGRLQSMGSQRVRQDLVAKQQHLPLQSLAFIIQPLQTFLQCWGSPHIHTYIYIHTHIYILLHQW